MDICIKKKQTKRKAKPTRELQEQIKKTASRFEKAARRFERVASRFERKIRERCKRFERERELQPYRFESFAS